MRVRNLRTAIARRIGRPLRVVIYARYSTEDQRPTSIEDQFALCKKFLREWGVHDAEVTELSDFEMSGELVNRPGIDEVRCGVEERRWELIVAEDSSRLFRNPSACEALVGEAVDNGIRGIFPGDDVDTNEEGWLESLREAQSHHSRSNAYTRKRVKRSLENLFENKGAIGLLKPGYKRTPSRPATATEPAKGPFYDAVDPNWSPIILEAYQRADRGAPLWLVAKWLTEVGLPKTRNSIHPSWTEKNVRDLLRRPDYRGCQKYRMTVAKKIHKSGKNKQVRNIPSEVLERQLECLRIVPDVLWYRVNKKIDARASEGRSTGADHPLAGIPRDSRGPLSTIFYCGVCGGKMHMEGRNEGGYRCAAARQGNCWNRATALRALSHQMIGTAIVNELLSESGISDALARFVQAAVRDEGALQRKIKSLQAGIDDTQARRKRWLDKFEEGSSIPDIDERVAKLSLELANLTSQLDDARRQIVTQQALPSSTEIEQRVKETSSRLLTLNSDVAGILKRIIDGPIKAIPFQQFGTRQVVLRAEIKLKLVGLLPDDLFELLQAMEPRSLDAECEVRTVFVDLFKALPVREHAIAAQKLHSDGIRIKDIANELGIKFHIAEKAIRLGQKLVAEGLANPYIRLTECPESAARWRLDRYLSRNPLDMLQPDAT